MIYLGVEDLLLIAEVTLGTVELRDAGLLESAAARPAATVFGEDAYPDVIHKTAALMHSLARSHPLVDGNKRLALAAVLAFLRLNGHRLAMTEDEAYDVTMAVAAGDLDDVAAIVEVLEPSVEAWPLT